MSGLYVTLYARGFRPAGLLLYRPGERADAPRVSRRGQSGKRTFVQALESVLGYHGCGIFGISLLADGRHIKQA